MAAGERWFFSKDQLESSPSRKFGIDVDRELTYRQQAANLIQDMGQRLHVSQICINTAIVYMHRFYVFHSFTQFHRNSMAAAALFLAGKVEEQPRKLEHVIKVAHMCLRTTADNVPVPDSKSEAYAEQAAELVFNEGVLLQTLGFDVAVDHPHTHVVRCCHLVKAPKDLAQMSYFLASNSLHLTTMCLQYKPTIVACFCIHLACKWSNWEIPNSSEGKDWFYYVDQTVTTDLLKELTQEFIQIYNKCPSRLKRKIMSMSATQGQSMPSPGGGPSSAPTSGDVNFPVATCNSPMIAEPKKMRTPPVDKKESSAPFHPKPHGNHGEPKPGPSSQYRSMSQQQQSSLHESQNPNYLDYKEKKEREQLEREKHHMKQPLLVNPDAPPNRYSQMPQSSGHNKHPSSQPRSHPHHHRSSSTNVDPKYKMQQQQSSSNRDQGHYGSGESLAKDPIREAARDFRKSREQATKDMRDSRHGREAPPAAGRDPTRDIIREVVVRNHSKDAPVNDTAHGIDHSEQSSDCNGEQQMREHYSNYQSSRDFSTKLIRHDDVMSNSNSELLNNEVNSNNRHDPNARAKPNSNSNSAVNNSETNNSNKSINNKSSKQYASKQYPTPMSYNELLNTAYKNKQNSQQSIDKNYLNKVPSNIPQQMHSNSGSQQKTKQPPYGVGTDVPSQDKNPVPSSVAPQIVNKKSELPSLLDDLQGKTKSVDLENSAANRLQMPPPPVKVRSIFSPDKEKTPTLPKHSKQNKTPDVTQFPLGLGTVPPAVSPFGSPPFSSKNTPDLSKNRNRTYSSSSEPELIPIVKNLEDMSGFVNIIRDSKMGIKLHKVPESTPPVQDNRTVAAKPTDAGRTKFPGAAKQEEAVTNVEQTVRSEPQSIAKQETTVIKKEPLVNGLEPSTFTDSTIKQIVPVDMKSDDKQKLQPCEVETVIQPTTETAIPTERKSEHHHKSEKKKKKEKHKHKDKERSREEKEMKKKHKEKDRERHKDKSSIEQAVSVAPLKIKLPKEKVAPAPQTELPIPTGLKIKIPKERFKTDAIASTNSPGSGSLKTKMSKDKIENLCNAGADSSSKRKREAPSPQTGPPAKVPNYNRSSESRQNGRSSYNAKQGRNYNRNENYHSFNNNKYSQMPPRPRHNLIPHVRAEQDMTHMIQHNQYFYQNYLQMQHVQFPATYNPAATIYPYYPGYPVFHYVPSSEVYAIQQPNEEKPPLPLEPPPEIPPPPPPE